MSLFGRLIGARFERLPACVRAVHENAAARTYSGRCRVVRGESLLSRLCGFVAGMPPAAERAPIRVEIRPDAGGETWTRDFGGHRFSSRMRDRNGLLEERLGPGTLRFALVADEGAIRWELRGMRVLGVPVPAFAEVAARESEEGGAYRFDVRVALRGAGLLIHYQGTLDVP